MDLSQDEAIAVWRSRVSPGYYKVAFSVLKRFYHDVLRNDFHGASFNEIVEWQTNAVGRDRARILRSVQKWVNEQKLSYKTKNGWLSYVRSPFLHNQADLPTDRSFRFRGDKPPVEGKLSLEVFKRIVLNSNKLYRAVFLMMAQGIMGCNELVYVSNNLREQVLKALTKNVGVFKLTIPGRKRNRNVQSFHTILSTKGDWAFATREYLKSLSGLPKKALYVNTHGNPLTEARIRHYFLHRAVETGAVQQFSPQCPTCNGETIKKIEKHKTLYVCKECEQAFSPSEVHVPTGIRYGVNPHEIRDLMRSRWQVSQADPLVCEFMMGHTIDPNNYNKFTKYEPWYPVQEYRKALPWLNVVSCDPQRVDRGEVSEELEAHRTEVDLLRRELVEVKQRAEKGEKALKLLSNPKVWKFLEEKASEE